MMKEYLDKAMARAVFEKESGRWFGEIPGFPGVWADGITRKECAATLREVLEGWLLLKIQDRDGDIPVMEGIDLNKIGVPATGA